MPQSTPKLGLVCYDLVSDGSVYFSTFRNTLAGYTNSALIKIDDFALRIDNDVTQLKLNPPIVRVSAIRTSDFLYEVAGVTEITEYRNNVYINLSLDFTNIGTVSLNINGLGAKGVYKIGNDGLVANLSAGDLKQNKMHLFRYNGTYWVWVNAVTSDQLNVVGTAGNLTKISTNNTLEDAGVTFATTVTNNTIAQRTSTGQIKVATPVATEDASTKGYTDAVDNKIGDLTNFTTTDKTNVVNAVNEIDGKNYMYGDPVSEFENFDPINAQFLEGNPASYFSTKAYADTKAPIASPAFTGAPSSVTPATGDNTTKIATTAFVNAEIANDRPYATTPTTLVNGGTGVVGTSVNVARADHTHTTPQSVLQSQVINDLTTGGITDVLSAEQGVELSSAIGQKVDKTSIINDLTTGGIADVLSAEQGKTLNINKLDKSGGTLVGVVVAQNNTDYTVKQVRNVVLSTADPTGFRSINHQINFIRNRFVL